MSAVSPSSRPPLSRHRAFVPLVTLWLATLVGGTLAVLPAGQALAAATGLGLTLPAGLASDAAVSIGAAIIGGLIGLALASIIAGKRPRRPRNANRPHTVAPLELNVLFTGAEPENALESRNIPHEAEVKDTHGQAVRMLRAHAPGDLAMPQLIERLAVAMADYEQREAARPHTYTDRAPPAVFAAQLRMLFNGLPSNNRG
ncbi:hypothetical protein G6N82_07925 [Altererythrobacter sp. BO-6]|uniref:hypothetical protein n=1 Tax=Altererythrobacter sp. BO-6 TaxID=2604537 RepID=UPI0013E11D94|nr:hypothetical protein [Altererythrobacter sp. BO-6]QIG54088.1 hypothetical protein G6N82_07925 [Altererythrobacter sp. BO-6]